MHFLVTKDSVRSFESLRIQSIFPVKIPLTTSVYNRLMPLKQALEFIDRPQWDTKFSNHDYQITYQNRSYRVEYPYPRIT